MSRSFRKPYFSHAGGDCSEHDDKRIASRSWRRLIKQTLQNVNDFDSYLIPHKFEAPNNDRWTWKDDGGNIFWDFPTRQDLESIARRGLAYFDELRKDWLKLQRK